MDLLTSIFKSGIFEGIGNEVLLTALTLLIPFICITIYIFVYFTSSNLIHPSNQEAVNNARHHLNVLYSNRLNHLNGSTNQSFDANSSDNQINGNFVNLNHYGMDHQCPVCLNEPIFPVETNCGHLFCGQCIVVYWRHGTWIGPVPCPVCRQQVSLILQCFRTNQNNLSEQEQTEIQRILHDINDYNRRFSGEPRPWLDYIYDLPTLLRHITSEFFSVGGIMYVFRIRIIICFTGAIMYLISPLDMVPEAVFGLFGLLDDVFVVLLLAIYITIIYRRFLANRWEEESF